MQRRAARFTINCYVRYQSVTDMFYSLAWPTKIVYNIVHIQPDIPLTYSKAVYTRGHYLKKLIFSFSSEVVELITIKVNLTFAP